MKARNWICAGVITIVPFFAANALADEKQHGTQGEQGEAAEIPGTAAEIWHEIHEHVELLTTTITSDKLADVHSIAFAIRDLVKGLPEKSQDLAESKLKLLSGYIQRIAEHAKNLDTYGDAGEKSKTQAEFEQLKKRLDYMRKLYPDSTFHGDDEHHG